MCDPITFTLLAVSALSTGVSVIGANQQARAAEDNAKFQVAQATADANAAQGDAMVEAERIRRESKRQRAAAVAAAAASGVDVNSPTAVRIDQEIATNGEHDAYMTLLDGMDHAARLRQAGTAASITGQNQAYASKLGAVSSVLSFAQTATNNGNGWKKAR
jgi:hypothetical protein